MDRNNNVDKDIEKWVEEQHAFFEKKREKQSDEVPARFDPKGPVTILQRRHYASASMSGQVPQRLKDSKYTQSQPNNWTVGYEGTWYRKEFGAGYNPKVRNGLKEMAMGKGMVPEKRKGQTSPIGKMEPKIKLTIPPKNQERMVNISKRKVLVTDKMGTGEMKAGMIKGNLEIPNMTLKIRKMRKVIQKIPVS